MQKKYVTVLGLFRAAHADYLDLVQIKTVSINRCALTVWPLP